MFGNMGNSKFVLDVLRPMARSTFWLRVRAVLGFWSFIGEAVTALNIEEYQCSAPPTPHYPPYFRPVFLWHKPMVVSLFMSVCLEFV